MPLQRTMKKIIATAGLAVVLGHPMTSNAQMSELIMWSGEKLLGTALGYGTSKGLDSIFGSDNVQTGATPDQVKEIVETLLNQKLAAQTTELKRFIERNSYKELSQRQNNLKDKLARYASISTGFRDRHAAISEINQDDVSYVAAFISAAMEDVDRQKLLPQYLSKCLHL